MSTKEAAAVLGCWCLILSSASEKCKVRVHGKRGWSQLSGMWSTVQRGERQKEREREQDGERERQRFQQRTSKVSV